MIYKTHAEILTILLNAPNCGMATQEIFKQACDNPTTQIPDPESLSKYIYNLRGKGFLTSSDGKKRIHKITNKGIAALDEFNSASIQETFKTKEITMTTDNLLEGLQVEQPFLLDPNSELDAPFITIINALRDAQIKQEPIKIDRKDEKISTLLRLCALMSDDIKAVFDDIIADLERL